MENHSKDEQAAKVLKKKEHLMASIAGGNNLTLSH